jgi:hypothetical protein
MTFVAQKNPLTGKPYGGCNPVPQVDRIQQIKEKYSLAIEYLKDKRFHIARGGFTTIAQSSDKTISVEVCTSEDLSNSPAQDQIGELLAEFLNSLTKQP